MDFSLLRPVPDPVYVYRLFAFAAVHAKSVTIVTIECVRGKIFCFRPEGYGSINDWLGTGYLGAEVVRFEVLGS